MASLNLNVIKKPLVSEKTTLDRDDNNHYAFLVDRKATKEDIKGAVEELFEVNVTAVNTSIKRGKLKKRGANMFLTKKIKKAFVSVKAGQKIKIFDEQ